MSDQRHIKTVVPPPHLTRQKTHQLPQCSWPAEPLWQLHCDRLPAGCRTAIAWLSVYTYIYRFLRSYLAGSLLVIMFGTSLFLIYVHRYAR